MNQKENRHLNNSMSGISISATAADPFDALIEAGEESADFVATVEARPDEPTGVLAEQPTTTERGRGGGLAIRRRGPRAVFRLGVRREPNGNPLIEASAEAASTLGALFEGMAAMLGAAAINPDSSG